MEDNLEEEFSCVVAEEEDFEDCLDTLLRRFNVKKFIGLYSLDGYKLDSMMTCPKPMAKVMIDMAQKHLAEEL